MSGRTGCDFNGANCTTNDCGSDGRGGCKPACGYKGCFVGGATLLVFRMSNYIDWFNLRLTNGIQIGVSTSP